MSIAVLTGRPHNHTLSDYLKLFIYVVLYCALTWLLVGRDENTQWWLETFFGAGGFDSKQSNALNHQYTESLVTSKSVKVMDWLNQAMDLHFKDSLPNQEWKDGKVFGDM